MARSQGAYYLLSKRVGVAVGWLEFLDHWWNVPFLVMLGLVLVFEDELTGGQPMFAGVLRRDCLALVGDRTFGLCSVEAGGFALRLGSLDWFWNVLRHYDLHAREDTKREV